MRIFGKKKWQQEQRKRHVIHNLLSSFVVVTVVVVVAIIQPSPAFARFVTLETVGTDVYYQIEIFDDFDTLTEGSLKIVAESSLDKRETSSSIGYYSGSFSSLQPNTTYDIAIRGKRGYGEFSLAKSTVMTSSDFEGKILDVVHLEGEYIEDVNSYRIQLAYSDRLDKLSRVYFYYTFTSLIDNRELSYESIMLTDTYMEVIIDVPKERGEIRMYLEAITHEDDTLILDSRTQLTPLIQYASLYVADVGERYIDLSAYAEVEEAMDVRFFLQIYESLHLIERREIRIVDHYENDEDIRFTSLKQDTIYRIVLIAQYFDTYLNKTVEENVTSVSAKTAPPHSVDVKVTETTDKLNILINIQASYAMFTNMRLYVYSIEEDMLYYRYSENMVIEEKSLNHYQAFTSIDKPEYVQYIVRIYVDKCIDDTYCYPWIILYETNKG